MFKIILNKWKVHDHNNTYTLTIKLATVLDAPACLQYGSMDEPV